MGNKVATFTEQQLEDYQVSFVPSKLLTETSSLQDCTFFTRKEILT